MKFGDHRHGTVDLSDVRLAASEAACDAIHQGIQEAVGRALESQRTYLDVPAIWGKVDAAGRSDNALVLEIGVDVGADELKMPTYAVDLRDVVGEYLKYCREDGLFADGLEAFAKELRRLADEIESVAGYPGHG